MIQYTVRCSLLTHVVIEEAYVPSASESGLPLTLNIWKYHRALTLLSMGNYIMKIFFLVMFISIIHMLEICTLWECNVY